MLLPDASLSNLIRADREDGCFHQQLLSLLTSSLCLDSVTPGVTLKGLTLCDISEL